MFLLGFDALVFADFVGGCSKDTVFLFEVPLLLLPPRVKLPRRVEPSESTSWLSGINAATMNSGFERRGRSATWQMSSPAKLRAALESGSPPNWMLSGLF